MNPAENPPFDPALLDLLVDGELSDPQRRELLRQLETAPDGWRACALAFLEAQCWKESTRPPVPPAAPKPAPPQPPASAPRRRSRWSGAAGTIVAMAASFLLALGVGVGIRSAWRGAPLGVPGNQVASSLPGEAAAAPGGAGPSALAESPRESRLPRGADRDWEMVRVALPGQGDGASGAIDLPVKPHERLDGSWFEPAPVPPEVARTLRGMGCELKPSRRLVPAPLDDGRRVVVPVDEWEIRYVGNGALQ